MAVKIRNARGEVRYVNRFDISGKHHMSAHDADAGNGAIYVMLGIAAVFTVIILLVGGAKL